MRSAMRNRLAIRIARAASETRQSGRHPGGRDFPDGIVEGICNIDEAIGVHRHALRKVEHRVCAHAIAAAGEDFVAGSEG